MDEKGVFRPHFMPFQQGTMMITMDLFKKELSPSEFPLQAGRTWKFTHNDVDFHQHKYEFDLIAGSIWLPAGKSLSVFPGNPVFSRLHQVFIPLFPFKKHKHAINS